MKEKVFKRLRIVERAAASSSDKVHCWNALLVVFEQCKMEPIMRKKELSKGALETEQTDFSLLRMCAVFSMQGEKKRKTSDSYRRLYGNCNGKVCFFFYSLHQLGQNFLWNRNVIKDQKMPVGLRSRGFVYKNPQPSVLFVTNTCFLGKQSGNYFPLSKHTESLADLEHTPKES